MTSSGYPVPKIEEEIIRLYHVNRTILVVGDSSMRFLYSALVDSFGIVRPYPHHSLPESDPCAFSRVGWPSNGPCAMKWRGPCRDANAGCTYNHSWRGIKLKFVWWRNGLRLKLPVREQVDLLLTSAGIWESMAQKNMVAYRDVVRTNVLKIVSAVGAKQTILFSNGVCRRSQNMYFRNFNWPDAALETSVLSGNRELSLVADSHHLTYFDRSLSMLTKNDTVSPCVNHHPYGKASDLHALFALSRLK